MLIIKLHIIVDYRRQRRFFQVNQNKSMKHKKVYYERQGTLDLRGFHPSQWIPVLNREDWEHVRTVQLERGKISEDNIYQFLKFNWPNLQKLDLNQNNLGDLGVDQLLCKDLLQLKALFLSETGTTEVGLRPMLNNTWINLLNLSLSRNKLGSSGIKLLVKADMPALLHLTINYCEAGEEGLKHLSKGKWTQLETLNPRTNFGNLNGHLSIFGHWRKLQHLFIGQFNTERYIYPNIPIYVLACIATQPAIKMFATVENYQIQNTLAGIRTTLMRSGLIPKYTIYEMGEDKENQRDQQKFMFFLYQVVY